MKFLHLQQVLATCFALAVAVQSFAPSLSGLTPAKIRAATPWRSTSDASTGNVAQQDDDEKERQWELFRKHHAKGSWKGIWTTYDYIGDVMDETIASVNYYSDEDGDVVEQTHSIVTGAKRSDCPTCFDSMEQKEFPVKLYDFKSPQTFAKTRFAANAMVNGPSLLKSGVMATELILAYGDGRVRVTFQHAPVWEAGVEPGSGPPQGLKLVRTMVSREAMRPTAPTAETEAANPPAGDDNPIFYRPVPPFNWHKKWGGTSWTWGPNSGDRGWSIENLEEEDSWQGISTVERWNLRLPGGIFLQAPRVITNLNAELCRLAWLPNDDTLLRVEAGCLALQPMVMEDDQLVGFYPPSLTSLRCDVLKKLGELDQIPSFVAQQQQREEGEEELQKPNAEEEEEETVPQSVIVTTSQPGITAAADEVESEPAKAKTPQPQPKSKDQDDNNDSGLQAVRDALSL